MFISTIFFSKSQFPLTTNIIAIHYLRWELIKQDINTTTKACFLLFFIKLSFINFHLCFLCVLILSSFQFLFLLSRLHFKNGRERMLIQNSFCVFSKCFLLISYCGCYLSQKCVGVTVAVRNNGKVTPVTPIQSAAFLGNYMTDRRTNEPTNQPTS